jgi:hypothetical protein
MDEPWIETVGGVSLFLFAALVGACLIGAMVRVARGRRAAAAGRRPPAGRADALLRLFVEYVGNTSPDEAPPGPAGAERRHNWQARVLMDIVRREMFPRDAAPAEREALLERLRTEMHAEGPGPWGQGS